MRKQVKLYTIDIEALLLVKKIVESDLEHFPSIQKLSLKCGLNRDKLKRGFKQLFGMPVEGYHRFLRIEEAKRLLKDTDKTIYEIAWLTGYERSQSFSVAFKRVVGMRPGEWRIQVKEGSGI